jgi:bacillithiol system protein YtxJ
MGLFSRKPAASKPKKEQLPWVRLESIDQLNQIIQTTHDKPVLLFKHSTRCGVSTMALNSFENTWSSGTDLANIYILDLLNHRDVSNEIAVLTGIVHQSPQVIVLKGSEIVYDASHSSIDARRIESILKKG